VFKAFIVEDDATNSSDVRDALADAGCVDIESVALDEAIAMAAAGVRLPDLAVVNVSGPDLPRLHRFARSVRELPILVVCEERFIDAAHLAGAVECVTTPVRRRELLGRIRCALRARSEERHRAHRERRLSDAIDVLKREKEDLERLVCVDALTGIANRRHALALLDSEWRRSSREHLPLGLVMIDVDCYHQYNEQYGHLAGDDCLQRICEAMVKCLRRPSDYLGRYGGEEFIAVLPNTDAVGAKIVAERLRASVEGLAIEHCASACAKVVTISAGFASLRAAGDLTMDRLIAVADGALLRAKASGRNRIEGDAPLVRPMRVSAQRWQRFEPVHADPWFADRIPTFLAEASAGARNIIHALRNDQMHRIQHTATSLRATSRELGLAIVERLTTELERAAIAADVSAARETADELIQYVTHVQVIYRRANEPAVQPLAATAP
jgi:diguanylate cyclase (GGDEF)-like protein